MNPNLERNHVMTDEADDEPYFFVTPDKDWPEAYFAIVARDEDGRGYEFCGKIVNLELAESIAAFQEVRREVFISP